MVDDSESPVDAIAGSIDREPEEKRVIGDLDVNTDSFWGLYDEEVKRDDEAQIRSLKDNMDSVLIFVCSPLVHIYGLSHVDSCAHRPVYFPQPSSVS